VKVSEIGSCRDTDIDSPDVLFAPEGSGARHSVSVAVDKNQMDAVFDIFFTKFVDRVSDVLIKMLIWMIGWSRISTSSQR